MAGNNEQNSRVARKRSQPQPPKKHWFRRIILALLALFVIGALSAVGLFFYYAQTAPTISEAKMRSENSTRIYDADKNLIADLGSNSRQYVKSKDIPDTLKSAVVSIEDRRFYKHKGVDYYRILGAALGNLKGSSLGMQGGSTLTMQLVKLSVFSTSTSDRNLRVKAQEAWLALNVEKHFSKSQILEFYINKVYMGNGIYGMGTAAEYYYGKSLKQLNLSELALLAGMPQSPTYYDPTTYPTYATSRRNLVLEAMYDNKAITKDQETAAEKVSVKTGLASTHKSFKKQQTTSKVADSYLKEVIDNLEKKGYKPYEDGLKVYTNLNMNAQQRLYDIANTDNYVSYPNKRFQLGVSVVDSYTGKISAMIGGRKHTNVTFGLNRAIQVDRSNASTMKPILDYGPAIEYNSWPTYKTVADTKYKYPGSNDEVNDFDNNTLGNMTMRQALVQSRNIPAVKTLETVGRDKAKGFANKLGMNLKGEIPYSTAIGGYVSSLQVAGAYAAFANGGTYYKPYYINKIVTQDDETTNYTSHGKRVMKESTAYMITDMLKGVINSATGTGTTAKIDGVYQAGKTGTDGYDDAHKSQVPSDADVDSWMAGYTKNYSVAVWTGYDRPNDMTKVNYIDNSTAKISQDIYREMMTYLQQHSPNSDWTKPSSVGTVKKNGIEELYVVGHLFSSAEAASGTSSANNTSSMSSSSSSVASSSSSRESSEESSSEEASSSSEEEASSESSSEASSEASSSSEESSSSEAASSSSESQASSEAPATESSHEE